MITHSQTSRGDQFRLGCEVLLDSPPSWFSSGRLGLLANQASVSRSLENVKESILGAGGNLSCIFSPQHGFCSDKQANMIESGDSRDPDTGVPVVSLYFKTREPSLEALKENRRIADRSTGCGNAGLYVYHHNRPLPGSGSAHRHQGGRFGQAQSDKWYGN